MAKWCGKIGFTTRVEAEPCVWVDEVVEKQYYGEAIRITRRNQSNSSSVNDDLIFSSQISIIADPYANNNFGSIAYVEFMNAKWKVTNVEVQRPRLILTLGGIYSEQN